jgi:predicted CXXCH cytochrome family protein
MAWRLWKKGATAYTSGLAQLVLGLAVAVAGVAVSMPASAQSISTTKHNLGKNGPGSNKNEGTTEICVFCHTPHGADTTAAVPLWNRTIDTTRTYATYDSLGTTTLTGRTATVGSVSIACLSCHDGQTAMNVGLKNAPGSGAGGDAAWVAGNANWNGGTGKPGGIANLGTDLTNDHPVGIQYGGGGITASSPTGTLTLAGEFKVPAYQVRTNADASTTTMWWVDTGATGTGTRQKSDIMLYTRAASAGYTGQTAAEPFVECASCHDPHTTTATFLRIANTGSAVCLACHIK